MAAVGDDELDDAIAIRIGNMGGYRQIAEAQVLDNPVEVIANVSCLCRTLLKIVGWGLISPAMGGYLARQGVADGITHPDLLKLADIGTGGKHPRNSRRDMLRRFCKNMRVTRPLTMMVAMKNKALVVGEYPLSILSPFEFADNIFEKYPNLFARIFGTSDLRGFWNQVKPNDPRLSTMADVMLLPDWRDRVIPYTLHGDGAPFNKKGQLSIISLSWRGYLSDLIIPLVNLVSSARANHGTEFDTLSVACAVIALLFNYCRWGKHGTEDPWHRQWGEGTQQYRLRHKLLCAGRYFLCPGVLQGTRIGLGII